MGAHNFSAIGEGTRVATAYRAAVANAEAEYGTSPYNGTISTTDGYIVMRRDPMPLDDAHQLADTLLDDPRIARRGRAGAIPVLTSERTVTVTIPETPGGYESVEAAAEAAVAGQLRDGEQVKEYTAGSYELSPASSPYARVRKPQRILSGTLYVTLTGGAPTHTGWLFFGWAAS
ncbi:hypothetical protein ACFY05_32925 [Microtetraspora fusca]|uniref:Uncharacterized protein n=1 Tax=Microtetraspora fusca TaxID=1997 RepID=A0ABW6VEA5_MICFU